MQGILPECSHDAHMVSCLLEVTKGLQEPTTRTGICVPQPSRLTVLETDEIYVKSLTKRV